MGGWLQLLSQNSVTATPTSLSMIWRDNIHVETQNWINPLLLPLKDPQYSDGHFALPY
jgi:hypothetical protein